MAENDGVVLQFASAGPFALGDGEPGQVRKEAAPAILLKCRSQARHLDTQMGDGIVSIAYFISRIDGKTA